MSRSGVGIANDCVQKYDELKLGKKIKYIIYGLNPTFSQIIVLKEQAADPGLSPEEEYENFIAELPETDCRWAVYDFKYSTPDGERAKICFFSWSPDDAKVKSKMTYASSKDTLRRSLAGLGAEIQGTDFSEVAFETVLEKVGKR